ncbi:hypothetical protein PMI16_03943 [Herbaspirillum sp. CF444]|nr:hypothetical protein PMI16_03943 [Herbaspirillum sp. CF444]
MRNEYDMKIDASANVQNAVYETSAAGGKTAPADESKPGALTDAVTLSDAATRLADGLAALATAVAAMPVPEQPAPQSLRHRKQQGNGLSPMLDVDAFRLIRDKLRSRNLGLQEPDPVTKKLKDAVQEGLKI